jgi:hypothetical protein
VFYGYPVALIEQWCGVSRTTARLYKNGIRKPSRQALRLFTLHRDGRVLGPGWELWKVTKDVLVDPDGNETTRRQLVAYWIVVQFARELASRDPETRKEFWELLKRA